MKANLVTRGRVPLLANYEAAKAAVAACARVDECLSLSDKAVALRAYARQAKDKAMERNAQRIQIRALRKCGSLLKEKPTKAGGRGKVQGGRAAAHLEKSARAREAKEAGLSVHQKKTALRLASVPEADFEDAVEREVPPTVTELAEIGTAKLEKALVDNLEGRDPKDYTRSLHLRGWIHDLAKKLGEFGPETFVRGCTSTDIPAVRDDAKMLCSYLADVLARTGDS